MEGEKVPFASTVVFLEVSIDLSPIWKGAVNNLADSRRYRELLRSIAQGEATRSHLVNFAGYVLGFELKPTARMRAMSLSGPFQGATEDLRASCKLALSVIELSRPRAFIATVLPPIVLYTGGAYEGNKGCWGLGSGFPLRKPPAFRWLCAHNSSGSLAQTCRQAGNMPSGGNMQ